MINILPHFLFRDAHRACWLSSNHLSNTGGFHLANLGLACFAVGCTDTEVCSAANQNELGGEGKHCCIGAITQSAARFNDSLILLIGYFLANSSSCVFTCLTCKFQALMRPGRHAPCVLQASLRDPRSELFFFHCQAAIL